MTQQSPNINPNDTTPTRPETNAITDRQLLVDVAQKLSSLHTTVREGFESSASRDLEIVQRVTALETWRDTAESRLNAPRSDAPSRHDLEAAAALAIEVKNREDLAKKVDAIATGMTAQNQVLGELRSAVVTFWTSPKGKYIRAALWVLFVGWLAKNNVHIPGINP